MCIEEELPYIHKSVSHISRNWMYLIVVVNNKDIVWHSWKCNINLHFSHVQVCVYELLREKFLSNAYDMYSYENQITSNSHTHSFIFLIENDTFNEMKYIFFIRYAVSFMFLMRGKSHWFIIVKNSFSFVLYSLFCCCLKILNEKVWKKNVEMRS